jgi:biotin synthase
MSEETQALCFFAGANSIFVGDVLLTAENPGEDSDAALFAKLGLKPLEPDPCSREADNAQDP